MYYKLEQTGVKNWSRFILLQTGASLFTNQDKMRELLQIRTKFITSQGNYYKLWHNKC